ncbi:DUF1707 SHOCT-like domain-containing protein [Pseudonocardia humida]|uniref:DUF1707 SHOCT-like domain-containing protein n=1 Tax=Pseudonocardia humida TaxID=2800819 RepID=UPI00207C6F3E|nr:DUF1707 domain-containing protein [Pseudonocardia humida]
MDGRPEQPERPAVRPEDLRAGHADRDIVLDRLRAAHVEGRLDAEEFDERIQATLAARTYGELDALTSDLPPVSAVPAVAAGAAPAEDPNADFRSGVAAWAAASATTMAIWAISCLALGQFVFPWFLWVAGPWGTVLLVAWIGTRLQGR